VWAIAWLPVGAALAAYVTASPAAPGDLFARPIDGALFTGVWTIWGGVSGVLFALLLRATERRRTLRGLSLARTSLWGGLGSMALPVGLIGFDLVSGRAGSPLYDWRPALVTLGASALLGAGSAAATLLVARRPDA